MAIQYGSLKKQTFLLVIILCLLGCASGLKKTEIELAVDAEQPVRLLNTESYLPYLSVNGETGKRLPYAPQLNPYLKENGQLEKTIVSSFIQARRYVQQGELDKAKTLLQELTVKQPELSGPWLMLGDIAERQGDDQLAISHFARAIEVKQENVNAYIKLAIAQRKLGQFMHAQNTYTKALSVWKDFPEAHLNLSILYDVYLNKPVLAQKHLEAYQVLKPSDAQVTEWLSDLTQRTGMKNYVEADISKKEQAVLAQLLKDNLKAQEGANR